jgi:GST-like protein
MPKFYCSLTANPMKAALFLQQAVLPYEVIPVDTRKREHHAAEIKALNPNAE